MTPWLQTWTGRRVELLQPTPADIDLADIAHALARICRFTGHVSTPYSVAEHCVRVSHVAEYAAVPREAPTRADLARWGLLHDAAEAYTGDLSQPMKLALRALAGKAGSPFDMVENAIEATIRARFSIPWLFGSVETSRLERAVKLADLVLLATEARDLKPAATLGAWESLAGILPLSERIVPLSPIDAQLAFVERARELGIR